MSTPRPTTESSVTTTTTVGADAAQLPGRIGAGLFDPRQLVASLPDAIKKLDPRHMIKSPVMFVVEVGAVLTTVLAIADPSTFSWWVVAWLWFTVIFANLAEAVAEGRGRAQAATLRATKQGHPGPQTRRRSLKTLFRVGA